MTDSRHSAHPPPKWTSSTLCVSLRTASRRQVCDTHNSFLCIFPILSDSVPSCSLPPHLPFHLFLPLIRLANCFSAGSALGCCRDRDRDGDRERALHSTPLHSSPLLSPPLTSHHITCPASPLHSWISSPRSQKSHRRSPPTPHSDLISPHQCP